MTSHPAGQFQSLDCGVVSRAAERLTFAMSPVFAGMASLTWYSDSQAMLCGAGSGIPWNGMVAMYLLMSLAHLPPWLKLFSRVRDNTVRAAPRRRAGPSAPDLQKAT